MSRFALSFRRAPANQDDMYEIRDRLNEVSEHLRQNRYHDALKLCLEVLDSQPNNPDTLYLLASIAFRLHQPDQTLQWIEHTLRAAPDMARAWLLRARVLRTLQRPEESIEAADQAAHFAPEMADAWHCAGFVKMSVGRWAEAMEDLSRAVELDPKNPVVRSQYALALNENNLVQNAFAEVQRALDEAPGHPEIQMAKADILESAGYYDLARNYRPHDRIVTFAQAASIFRCGDFMQGLWAITARAEALHPSFTNLPPWQGAEDFGLHLVLAGEQGYGDMIQFLRYAPLLKGRVGKATFRAPRLLSRLVRHSMPSLSLNEFADPLRQGGDPVYVEMPAGAGAHARLMSLPLYFGPDFDFKGDAVPYLSAEENLRTEWRQRLADIPRPWIGIVWAGQPRHTNDHKRSMSFASIAPLVEDFGKHLVSLQIDGDKGEGLFDAAPFIKDFADSAALLAELDLLITIDSAPAHLAGALGRPVWTLLPFNPDWRWLLGREDTPWYPTMRLFRQAQPGDWEGVVARLRQDLKAFVGGNVDNLHPTPWKDGVLIRSPNAVPLPGIENEPVT
jgi:tetratricopeptide (TPR) repeat protein